jgi:hypothetical protein
MTQAQINERTNHYRKAFEAGRITGKELEGFMEALKRMAGH